MRIQPFQLKTKNKTDVYDKQICCASKCKEPSAMIHAATAIELPLCDRHWGLLANAVMGDQDD